MHWLSCLLLFHELKRLSACNIINETARNWRAERNLFQMRMKFIELLSESGNKATPQQYGTTGEYNARESFLMR